MGMDSQHFLGNRANAFTLFQRRRGYPRLIGRLGRFVILCLIWEFGNLVLLGPSGVVAVESDQPVEPTESLAGSGSVSPMTTVNGDAPAGGANPLDLDPQMIQRSPLLRRWLTHPPDIAAEIRTDPSFRTRLRLGYAQFPSTDQESGWNVGVEDIFIKRTGLTLSANYEAAFTGDRTSWGADLRYYVLPLGSIVNLAPQIGYRRLETPLYTTDGVNLGVKLLLTPSRTGAADLSLSQSWVSPGGEGETGITTLSAGYALTRNLRLSAEIQKQNSRFRKDSRVGIFVEWMF